MKPTELINALNSVIQTDRASFIWGPPGIGKSEIVKTVAEDRGLNVIDIRAILLDPIDLRGLPTIENNKTRWTVPSFLPQQGEGILFLDELNAAPPSVQAACFQLTLDRAIGDYTLPDGWKIIAAGNRMSDRAAAKKMPSALANRFIHFDLMPDVEDWCQWAIDNELAHQLVAFIKFRPQLLHNFDPNERAFPTPRSWAFLSPFLKTQIDPQTFSDIVYGTVGEAAGSEFLGFLRLYDELPTVADIENTPTTAPIPSSPSALFAVASALARSIQSSCRPDNFLTYLTRLPEEYTAFAIKFATRQSPALKDNTAFQMWMTNNAKIFS